MRVIVVGAGAVGSAVAFALADRGAEVILFERGSHLQKVLPFFVCR